MDNSTLLSQKSNLPKRWKWCEHHFCSDYCTTGKLKFNSLRKNIFTNIESVFFINRIHSFYWNKFCICRIQFEVLAMWTMAEYSKDLFVWFLKLRTYSFWSIPLKFLGFDKLNLNKKLLGYQMSQM